MKPGRPYKAFYLPALIIVATVLILLVVIAVSTYRNIDRDRKRAENSLLREGLVVIRAVEAAVRADPDDSGTERLRIRRIVEELSREPAVFRLLILEGNGEVWAGGPSPEKPPSAADVSSLLFLLKEKGLITRYRQVPGEERTFEVIKTFRPFAHRDPLALIREGEENAGFREEPLPEWTKDKVILVGLRPGAFEGAREQDIHHAILMGGILVILGVGAIYFIFIVQNYSWVDRSLARMKTYLENVVESMADGLISIDGQKKIVTLNRRAAEILGGEERDFKGRGVGEVMGAKAEKLLQGEGPGWIVRDREVEVMPPSGKSIPLTLSAAPLKDEAGQEMGWVLLLRDLREIRDLQERVRRGERLASLGRLAAGVAHEIRNPLSSIRGFAQFFQQRLKGQEKEREYASIMIKEVDRLNRVIAELLDFARPKEPRRELHPLENILEQSLQLLQPEVTAKKVRVIKIVEPGVPPVPIDRDQLSQAFLNLFLNALEAMEEGGTLRIVMKRLGEEGRDGLQVAIADTGRGIPRGDLDKVFEPFFSTKKKGTGLGLAIVHQIIEAHGGEIRLESQEGAGTTFFVTLPFLSENPAEKVARKLASG